MEEVITLPGTSGEWYRAENSNEMSRPHRSRRSSDRNRRASSYCSRKSRRSSARSDSSYEGRRLYRRKNRKRESQECTPKLRDLTREFERVSARVQDSNCHELLGPIRDIILRLKQLRKLEESSDDYDRACFCESDRTILSLDETESTPYVQLWTCELCGAKWLRETKERAKKLKRREVRISTEHQALDDESSTEIITDNELLENIRQHIPVVDSRTTIANLSRVLRAKTKMPKDEATGRRSLSISSPGTKNVEFTQNVNGKSDVPGRDSPCSESCDDCGCVTANTSFHNSDTRLDRENDRPRSAGLDNPIDDSSEFNKDNLTENFEVVGQQISSNSPDVANLRILHTEGTLPGRNGVVTQIQDTEIATNNGEINVTSEEQNVTITTTTIQETLKNRFFENPHKNIPYFIEKPSAPLCSSQFERPIVTSNVRSSDNIDDVENLCPCGCGYFLGEDNEPCSCGCSDIDCISEPICNDDNCESSCEKCQVVPEEDNSSFRNENLDQRNRNKSNEPDWSNLPLEYQVMELNRRIDNIKKENEYLKNLMVECSCVKKNSNCSNLPPIRATQSGLEAAIEILNSKCRSKDGIIKALADELKGCGDIESIARNLVSPCLAYTYWDFDRCSVYLYLSEPIELPVPRNFRAIREICECLLVVWELPTDISRILGYEIFADGCRIAYIPSAAKTEAIVSLRGKRRPVELTLLSVGENCKSQPVTFVHDTTGCPCPAPCRALSQ